MQRGSTVERKEGRQGGGFAPPLTPPPFFCFWGVVLLESDHDASRRGGLDRCKGAFIGEEDLDDT